MCYDYKPYAREIILNDSYGGFGFSDDFAEFIKQKHGKAFYQLTDERTDPIIISSLKEFGLEKASGEYSELTIRSIPPYLCATIIEYDGLESLHLQFPWKELAIALYMNHPDAPLLIAVKEGKISGIETGKIIISEWWLFKYIQTPNSK